MEEIIDTINQTLAKLNINIELLEPKKLEYLKKIEGVISNRFTIREKVNENNKKIRPSINNISIDTEIARATIYNHAELKKYIEFRIEEYDKDDYFKKIEKLIEKNAELEEVIKKMTERDVGIELMRRKILQLETDLKLLKKEKQELFIKNQNLIERLNKSK